MDGPPAREMLDLMPAPPPPPPAAVEVLVVDDSAAQAHLMRRVLERMDLTVRTARSGAEALAILDDGGGRIGMVLSDWQMPGMDGPDLCRALRARAAARPGSRYVYFVLLTAGGAKAGGLDSGADDYVSRPVDLSELRARVRAGLRMVAVQDALLHRSHEVATTLHELQTIQDATNRDLVEARKIQRAALPPERAAFAGGSLRLHLVTSGPVGGDLVGYADLGRDRIALWSIDVSGHGIASALMTGRLAELFSSWRTRHSVLFPNPGAPPDPPERVVDRINRYMLGPSMKTDLYFTIVLAYVDLASGAVEFCQAGHPHPMIRRADGTVEMIGDGGPPVGLLDVATFERRAARLAPGDALLLYSDGLTECEDTWGEMLGEAGLIDILKDAGPEPDAGVDRIEEGVRGFAGIAEFGDDMSMLYFRFDGRD